MDRQTRRTANTQLSLDSIHEGRVVRIEDYGAFVQIGDRRGLVHISQLASMRVERVADVVELNDNVWVKVIDVEVAEGGRDKLRLTMKNIPQDGTAIDAQESERLAQGLSKGIEQNLNSTIGIAVARDPMAKGLILKQSGAPARIINGYALLDDEEEDLTPSNVLDGEPTDNFKEKVVEVKPIGRGRGATLPAWMAAGQAKKEFHSNKKQSDRSKKSDKKKKRKKEKSRGSKKHSKESRKKRRRSESTDSSELYRKDRQRRRGSSNRDDRRRYSSSSDSSTDDSQSESDQHRRHSGQRRRRDDTQDRGRATEPFSSINDARRFVEQMEERKSQGNSGAT